MAYALTASKPSGQRHHMAILSAAWGRSKCCQKHPAPAGHPGAVDVLVEDIPGHVNDSS